MFYESKWHEIYLVQRKKTLLKEYKERNKVGAVYSDIKMTV